MGVLTYVYRLIHSRGKIRAGEVNPPKVALQGGVGHSLNKINLSPPYDGDVWSHMMMYQWLLKEGGHVRGVLRPLVDFCAPYTNSASAS